MKTKTTGNRQLLFFGIIVSVLAAIQVIVSNRLIALDNRLEKSRGEMVVIEKENEWLRQEIASASSIMSLKQKSKNLGLTVSPELLTIADSHHPLALGNKRE